MHHLHCSKTLNKYQFNDKWLLYLGIPILGLMFALLPIIIIKSNPADHIIWIRITVSFLFSAICWIGCRHIVFTLWRLFPWDKRPILHICLEVLAIFAYVSLLNLIIIWWLFVFIIQKEFVLNNLVWQNIFISNLVAFLVTTLHEGAFFYLQWKHNIKRSEDLEKSTYEAQYENLRSQVNPHFLFNSLNTLAAQVEENPEAVSFVENLSDFLRYSLSNTGRELVPLGEELNMIEKYKYLQQTRFGQNLEIEMEVPEENQHMYVAPLALQMLVENAIKHNIISKDKPLKIKIFMANNNYISIENNLQKKIEPGRSTGIGLKNIVNRYQYLTEKKVIVIESSTKYKVSVPLVEFESAKEKQ